MWWRNSLRIAAVIALGALNAACFQPMYATQTVSGSPGGLGTALAQVQVDRIEAPNGTPEARIAVELQNALAFELHGGSAISPTHQVKVRVVTQRSSVITDVNTGRVMAEITGIDAYFTVVELATGKTV